MDTLRCFSPRGYKSEQDEQVFSLKELTFWTVHLEKGRSGDNTSTNGHETEICSSSDDYADEIQTSAHDPQKYFCKERLAIKAILLTAIYNNLGIKMTAIYCYHNGYRGLFYKSLGEKRSGRLTFRKERIRKVISILFTFQNYLKDFHIHPN